MYVLANNNARLVNMVWELAPQLESLAVHWAIIRSSLAIQCLMAALLRGPSLQVLSFSGTAQDANEPHWQVPIKVELRAHSNALHEHEASRALREVVLHCCESEWAEVDGATSIRGVRVVTARA